MIESILNSDCQSYSTINTGIPDYSTDAITYIAIGVLGVIAIIFAYNISRKPAQHIHKKEMVEQPTTLKDKLIEGFTLGAGITLGSGIILGSYKIAKNAIVTIGKLFLKRGGNSYGA